MPIILEKMEQGSPEWFEARMGCITMSNAAKLLTGGKGVTRENYIVEVASEIISGMPAEQIQTWPMERGNLLEPFARAAYEAKTGVAVQEVGLGYLNEDKRISASPDGLRDNGGLEIKCQGPKAHLRTIIDAANPKKFAPQMQGCMWIFDVEYWDYCSFCPEVKDQPLFIMTLERDEEIIKRIEESALRAVDQVNEFVKLAKGNPSASVTAICNQAIELIDIMQNKEPEII